MRKLIVVAALLAAAGFLSACHETVKGAEHDTHEDVKAVGHHL